jgi:hypothetical protein
VAHDAPDAAPAVLNNLMAAGLVSHEMIGDPEKLASEAEALRVLCGLISGPVYRIEPFHYAFLAQAGDLDGGLEARAPEDWAGALEATLQAALGPDAVWVHPTDLIEGESATLAEQPVLFLKAYAAAAEEGIAVAEPGVHAVINARFAAETARLTAERAAALAAEAAAREAAEEAGLAARLWSIEAEVTRLAAGLAARREVEPEAALAPLAERIGGLAARIEAEAARATAFEERIGLALAEFLARIEARAERAGPEVEAEARRAFAAVPHMS